MLHTVFKSRQIAQPSQALILSSAIQIYYCVPHKVVIWFKLNDVNNSQHMIAFSEVSVNVNWKMWAITAELTSNNVRVSLIKKRERLGIQIHFIQ